MNELTEAINNAPLGEIISKRYPTSGADNAQGRPFKAAWRGDTNPSASLFRNKSGVWLLKDHATGEAYNAYQFLTKIEGLTHEHAIEELGLETKRSRREPKPNYRPRGGLHPVATTVPPGGNPASSVPKALEGRGFTEEDIERYGFREDDGDAIFPIPNPQTPENYKRRKAARDASPKYTYEYSGVGAPAWYAPNEENNVLLVVEGELNAMIAHSVLNGKINVLGVPGASHPIDPKLANGKRVFLYADRDKAGTQAKNKWLELLRPMAFQSITVIPSVERDFCDIAGQDGREALLEFLKTSMRDTQPLFTVLDRFVSDQHTVGMLRDNAKQFVTGEIKNPTGYHALDAITFGLPISGLVLVAALPSCGKSLMLRDILYYNVERGKSILLFSPDQSADSIYILLASRRCGIPAWRAQRKLYTPTMLDNYGGPEAITKAWGEAFDDTILNYSKRFRVTGESEVKEIKRLTERALDDGVTMFGGDYIQIFEPEDADGKEMDGKAIKDLKKEVHGWGVPFVLAAQLAKYKFGRHIKRDGIPYASDIEGSGRYFQASEQVYMIFNGEVYWKEYVDQNDPPPEPPGFHGDGGRVRVYIRKNKLGDLGAWRYLKWNKELLTFENL